MTCVTTVSYTIFVNGKPTRPFDARRGVRQGGPLSPYLFVLAMEYLTRILKTLKEKPDLNYHPRCETLHIVQLSFADDLLLFCRGDVVSINYYMGVQKILGTTKYLNEANIGIEEVMNMQEYSIRFVYDKLRGELPKVEWKRLICNNISSPKWIFNLYLAILGRLYTRDRLMGWGIAICSDCSLCGRATESHDHLFFKCNYSTVIWRKLLQWLGITRDVQGWNDKIQ
uniref:Uncharacterized protein LOC104222732 n=1 Tax=Nicotiana sylvestris TaxID=4096 RepID=A0A1U7WCD5_NICSY|nr:PREDICTED: uncharacterized protein LOC104222732 [Nicotiana sylvestris]